MNSLQFVGVGPTPLLSSTSASLSRSSSVDSVTSMPGGSSLHHHHPSLSSLLINFSNGSSSSSASTSKDCEYASNREVLLAGLDTASSLLSSLQAFNQQKWSIRYPNQLGLNGATVRRSTGMRRSISSASIGRDTSDGEVSDTEGGRPLFRRNYSTMETPTKARSSNLPSIGSSSSSSSSSTQQPQHPLSILSLDLKLGHPTAPTATLPALLPSLSLATLSQLLSRRLSSSLAHLTSLRSRVIDTSSRILVTGDLNAGKSTLVNALLRRDVMPSDQQPCTTAFCEVLDAESYNGGKEEIHAIKEIESYAIENDATYDRYPLEAVNNVQDCGIDYQILKAYVIDSRAKMIDSETNPSFIRNGLVSISLIDAPGLNRDTLSTTALFARQAEIDVIVFVVSAENHFTLSAKEFLWNASQEKAYVFIVVNKWSGIKDKARCMRVVGEQIQQLSPATWEARSELVHFVDAADMVAEGDADTMQLSIEGSIPSTSSSLSLLTASKEVTPMSTSAASFDHLEESLRSFVLLKRSKSKLAPAQHYLLNLLSDLSTLVDANVIAANAELAEALRKLDCVKPIHERLSAQRDEVEDGVDRVEESVVESVRTATWSRLERALGFVAKGSLVPPSTEFLEAESVDSRTLAPIDGIDSVTAPTQLPEYPGFLGVWAWAEEVKKTLVRTLEAEIRAAEDDARRETVAGVKKVMTDLGDKYLPGSAVDGERVFRPEVMFAKRRRGVGKLAARGVGLGLSLGVAALGTGWTAHDFDLTLLDLFDLERLYPGSRGNKDSKTLLASPMSITIEEDASDSSVVSVISVGLGALSLFGSRAVTIKGAVEAIASACDLFGSKSARRWAAPVVGVLSVGLAVFIIIDLPRAIPRNIGRKLQSSLASSFTSRPTSLPSSPSLGPPTSFSTAHSDRVARETRKVLRLAGWDLRERFRSALAKSELERKEVESHLEKTAGALKWLEEFGQKVGTAEEKVDRVSL